MLFCADMSQAEPEAVPLLEPLLVPLEEPPLLDVVPLEEPLLLDVPLEEPVVLSHSLAQLELSQELKVDSALMQGSCISIGRQFVAQATSLQAHLAMQEMNDPHAPPVMSPLA
jgi:hypothetical protein